MGEPSEFPVLGAAVLPLPWDVVVGLLPLVLPFVFSDSIVYCGGVTVEF